MRFRHYWHWSVRFLAFNALLSCAIALLYLATPSTFPDNWMAAAFLAPYFVGHFGLLCGLLFLPWLLIGLVLPLRGAAVVLSFWGAFVQTLLLIDTFVYQQYRFHINLFVLDLFFNGQGQIISFPWYMWAAVIAFVASLFLFQGWWALRLVRKVSQTQAPLRTGPVLGSWFLFLLISHILHIFADGMFYRPITKLAFIPPFAVPANAQGTLAQWGLVDVEKYKSQALMSFDEENRSLVAYPLEKLQCQGPSKPLNVLFIMVDSLRHDHMSATVMPNTHALSEKSLVFEKHFSGSNSTRGGVFSFFFGVPPLYFEKFRESHVGPILVQLFQDHHYQLGIFGSAPLTKPEFDQTVFATVPNLRKRSKAQEPFLRDQEITDEFLGFVESKSPKRPFMGFLFYDSAHEFSNAPDHTPFKPFLTHINYFALNNSTDPTLFLNRYRNSVHYIDSLIGRVLASLAKKKLLENTIVVFSSDHGKEFNDNKLNYWGHNSNFTDAQTQVPFFIYWPGRKPERFQKWTSHYDVPATFAEELFRCQTRAEHYSSGDNLVRHPGHHWILHGTYGDFGIRLADHFIVIKNTGAYEIVDHQYRPVENVPLSTETYNKALKEMRRFYQ
ncbi:MAG: DUF3413 domain-containing protein [Bdellovibrionales bacterium]